MIQKLKIKNFQTHKNLEIDCDPRVTTIIGPSDSGKSAVIRALQWIAFNRPRGDAHIRTGSKQASVILEADGHTFKRKKRSNLNLYQWNDQKFTAFGNDVPGQIQSMLNIREINFQGQHDKPFWFQETAGEVSRQLNQIVNLGIIDTTLKNLASRLRKTTTEKGIIQERVDDAARKRKELKPIRQQDTELKLLEFLQGEVEKMEADTYSLDCVVQSLIAENESVDNLTEYLEEAEAILRTGSHWARLSSRTQDLSDAVLRVKIEQKKIRDIPDINPLDYKHRSIRQSELKIKELYDLIEKFKEVDKIRDNNILHMTKAEKDFEDAIGETCPLCGAEKDKHANNQS